MKTTSNTLRKSFALVAALLSLQLCSCVSPALMQQREAALRQYQHAKNFGLLAYRSGDRDAVDEAYGHIEEARYNLAEVNAEIREEQAPNWEMARMVLQSPAVQNAIFNAASRNFSAPAPAPAYSAPSGESYAPASYDAPSRSLEFMNLR